MARPAGLLGPSRSLSTRGEANQRKYRHTANQLRRIPRGMGATWAAQNNELRRADGGPPRWQSRQTVAGSRRFLDPELTELDGVAAKSRWLAVRRLHAPLALRVQRLKDRWHRARYAP
ncbi:hypothetical protein TraAM80_04783 [Trypanosoma rangeli]|uniref:Uncharacterized protein n=1 Tax=Trypanosoma rangeli TaxID=5698 RepID=A0A422NHZ7_TRYRA|nr:uncharacterized protein TraAM80_04783 [Trypanosoma rangeli]RNF05014.1 hypothetical protein TraAM80_04783 [Trypanosoma rangeli]|eukprot:RNF05014.1 hypothetical protein TraAM80_04783 [Trypanosoma rangeli]